MGYAPSLDVKGQDVSSFKTSLRASEKARQVAGVRAVRNELNIRTDRT